jgi:hypothetical protein
MAAESPKKVIIFMSELKQADWTKKGRGHEPLPGLL